MKLFLFILMFTLSLFGGWPKASNIKIIIPVNAKVFEKSLAKDMAKFFAQGDTLIEEDMVVEDLYAEKFFTYYTDNFLVVLGTGNRLQRLQKRGVKLTGIPPFYTEQGTFKEDVAYVGLMANPLFLKARFIGSVKGTLPASMFIGGTNDEMTRHAWEQVKKGWVQGSWTSNSSAVERKGGELWGHQQALDASHKKNENDLLVRKYIWEKPKMRWQLMKVDSLGRLKKLD